MKLYPLKFKPILKPVIWGGKKTLNFKNIEDKRENIGESWELSAVENNVSIVQNGDWANYPLSEIIDKAKEDLVGYKVYEKFGNKFPLLIKFIDAQQNLSIQVHPNDDLAMQRHHSFGKTEMWYVVEAAPNAFIYSGFKKEITPSEYVKRVANNTFTEVLKKHYVKEGEVYFIPAGRVHAIGSGCFVAEIQQTSNITYRIYDYNRKDSQGNTRELHTELAKDAIDYTVPSNYKTEYEPKPNTPVKLVTNEYFTTNLLLAEKTIKEDISHLDSFIIYICLEGECSIEDNHQNRELLKKGETVLIPANSTTITIHPSHKTKLLQCYIE